MRYVVLGLVVWGSVAHADPYDWKKPNDSGVFLDIGGGWMRADPDGMTYQARYLRFAPQVVVHRWFYVGAAFQIGTIYHSSGTLNGMLPTQCSGQPGGACTGAGSTLLDETSGTIVEPQLVTGVRGVAGNVSGGFEIAPTVRWTTASASWLNQTFTTSVTTIELHARLDVWATPHFTAGIMVGSDYNTLRDLEGGLQIAFHFEPYDAMKASGP
ncbi:MAG: hypothetical protein ABI467_28975 [Kofleriaceae bacterium]